MALFGGTSDGRREPRSLVEFRAGKMTLSRGVVTADKRKGLVYMKTSSPDSLLHFYWKDRQTGEIVDDLIIFPGEADFVPVPQCTTGRVFLLKFKDHSSRRFFYWMQEPSSGKDEDLVKKVNDLLTHPPDPQASGEGGVSGMPPGYMAIPSSQLQSLLGGAGGRVDQQQLMELLGGAGGFPQAVASMARGGGVSESQSRSHRTPASSAPPPAAPQAPPRPVRTTQQQLDDLQNILSALNVPGSRSQQPPSQSQQEQPQQDTTEEAVSLNEVFSSEVIRPLTHDEQLVSEVSSHLPPTGESVEDVLSSPQFQAALSTFHSGLTSGQLGPLMSQFGLGDSVMQSAASGNLQVFAEALQGEMGGGVASGGVGGASAEGEGVASDVATDSATDEKDNKAVEEGTSGGKGEGEGSREGEDEEEGGGGGEGEGSREGEDEGEGGREGDGGGGGEGEGEKKNEPN